MQPDGGGSREGPMASKKTWYLRKNDGSEYGPVSMADLLRWSAQCRIVAGNAVSSDREEWIPVEALPELQMDWVAQRADGKEYGPFALDAVQELFDHKVLPADAILVNRHNGGNKPLSEVIHLNEGNEDGNMKTAVVEKTANDNERKQEDGGHDLFEEKPSAGKMDSSVATPDHADSAECIRLREAMEEKTATHAREKEQLQQESETLRKRVDELERDILLAQKSADSKLGASLSQIETLQEELERLRVQVEESDENCRVLEADQHREMESTMAELADLRKQTAFMKKNIAVLNAEVEAARSQAKNRSKVIIVLGMLLTLLVAFLFLRSTGGCRPSPRPESPLEREVLSTVAAVARPALPRPTSAGEQADPRWPVLRVDGVHSQESPDRLTIRFDDSVFTRMDVIDQEASGRLTELSAQLRPHLDRFRLEVEGHTDNVPLRPSAAFPDNQALAAARADAVVRWLVEDGGLPADAVRAALVAGPAPYSNDTAETRRRNRTVVLLLLLR